ncbi:FAD-dependent oxidoreductase [Heliobacterium gestii]|uniref:FAD-dependent oxidoreductase n=1 Tax=Heliomicrobium gestii TaxID=2699 RepID=A0A845L8H7_HELGE|nr:DsrE/DsrF/DrsH-like family protein [Heliomicrobium gestii]MBM7866275.1 NADPH-dependent 2,4-dienoyl-CoA reductase/sulfur reductase-like enzyme/peroxiredoxin family protein/rhodanese-related sulfurtransferase/TusA-related sulfurtransferase [Heliomicrobium gestii]MZP42932.1 FAD-dependent oxidoreductase [Heliomicrobium gestii]
MSKKVVIVGGVAGGASTAARLRRLDEQAEIILFERDGYISFANCGLPYYVGETIVDRSNLILQTPEMMQQRFNIDARLHSDVIAIDATQKRVTVKSADRGVYEETYDALVLSPGAKPFVPPIPGVQSERIFTVRNIPDTDRIKAVVDERQVDAAIVIGGGFIGVEMAENLVERGIAVTLVEAAPHILPPFDDDMVTLAEKELADQGVRVIVGDGVTGFAEIPERGEIAVTLQSGARLTGGMVILAIGVKPDVDFLKDSGLQLGPRGHIIVNDRMETNLDSVYAVGDAIQVVDFVNGSDTAIPLAGPANKQGRIAADNICGIDSRFRGSQGTSIIKIFGLTGAVTGNNERTLRRLGRAYRVVHIHPNSHASYYPGATPITLKVIFDETGKVLGAQAFGYDGVDKRIDVIATVIRMGGTIDDLKELELSYAPPYSSAKDPVNMAGFLAENVLAGRAELVVSGDIDQMDRERTVLLDVRTDLEFENGSLPGAIHIPLDELRQRLGELDQSKEYWVYCKVGFRGYLAERILVQRGFRAKNLSGGYASYEIARYKVGEAGRAAGAQRQSLQGGCCGSGDTGRGSRNDGNDSDTGGDSCCAATVAASARGIAFTDHDRKLDACGLCCPGPLLQVKKSVDEMAAGQRLYVEASDPGFYKDIEAWCRRTGNGLLNLAKDGGRIKALIQKGDASAEVSATAPVSGAMAPLKDNKTIVVFSGDLDKAIASFIIANGAASMGKKVTLFFTFWGLNILKKENPPSVTKGIMDNLFSMMMPSHSKKLPLSKMNMLGMGAKMIRMVMRDKNVQSLEDLIQAALDQGIELVACQMSMDVMGVKAEELIDGVKIGGVGYYLGEAEESNVNLFI